jgi:hypothetical protein
MQVVRALCIYGTLPVGPRQLAAPAHRINRAVIAEQPAIWMPTAHHFGHAVPTCDVTCSWAQAAEPGER